MYKKVYVIWIFNTTTRFECEKKGKLEKIQEDA